MHSATVKILFSMLKNEKWNVLHTVQIILISFYEKVTASPTKKVQFIVIISKEKWNICIICNSTLSPTHHMYPGDNTISEIVCDKPVSDGARNMIQDQAGAFCCVVPLLFCTRFGDVIL
jgi:hypothetical protein